MLVAGRETGLEVNAEETESVVTSCERNTRHCQTNKSNFDASGNWKQTNCVNSLSHSIQESFIAV